MHTVMHYLIVPFIHTIRMFELFLLLYTCLGQWLQAVDPVGVSCVQFAHVLHLFDVRRLVEGTP